MKKFTKYALGIAFLVWMAACGDGRSSPQGGTITSVQPTSGGGLAGGGTGGTVHLGLLTSCDPDQVLAWSGTAWVCADADSGGDITGVTASSPLSGGGTTGALTIGLTACSTNQIYKYNGSAWACSADADSGGDITGVAAVSPLTGTATSGNATIQLGTGDWGDVVTSGTGGAIWTIDNDVVTYAKMQNVSATNRLMCRITAGAGDMEECTGTQATTLLDSFTSSLKGIVPASGGGTSNFLRADGTWAAPSSISGLTSTHIPKATGSTTIADSPMTVNANGTFSIPTPSAGDALTAAGAVTTSGPINATGGTSWIQAGAQVYAFSGNTTLQNKGISFDYNTNGNSGGFINAVGYADGTTQFRDLNIQNGKGADIAVFTGSTKAVDFAGAITIAGNATFGDASTDDITFVGSIAGPVYHSGTAASLGTCSGGTIVSNSNASRGRVTAPDINCTINFNVTYAATPSCSVTVEHNTSGLGAAIVATEPSTTALIVHLSSKPNGIAYQCDGTVAP